jgi:hypothetical protein
MDNPCPFRITPDTGSTAAKHHQIYWQFVLRMSNLADHQTGGGFDCEHQTKWVNGLLSKRKLMGKLGMMVVL